MSLSHFHAQEAERKRDRQEVMRKQLIEANNLQLQLKVMNHIILQSLFMHHPRHEL